MSSLQDDENEELLIIDEDEEGGGFHIIGEDPSDLPPKDGKDGKDGATPIEFVTIGSVVYCAMSDGRRLRVCTLPAGRPGKDGKDGVGRNGKDGIGFPGKDAAEIIKCTRDADYNLVLHLSDGRVLKGPSLPEGPPGKDGIDGVDGKEGEVAFFQSLPYSTGGGSPVTRAYINGLIAGLEHNQLPGLQGGTTGQYYHLTASEYDFIQNLPPILDGFVPYTGATQDVDLGSYGLIANSVVADTLSVGTINVPDLTPTYIPYVDADGNLADSGASWDSVNSVFEIAGNLSAVQGIFSGAVSGTTGTFTGLVTGLNGYFGSTADATTATKSVTVESNGFATFIANGDVGSGGGEPGGAAFVVTCDGRSTGSRAVFSFINSSGQDGTGSSYSGTGNNTVLLGVSGNFPLLFGTNGTVRGGVRNSGELYMLNLTSSFVPYADSSGNLVNSGISYSSASSGRVAADALMFTLGNTGNNVLKSAIYAGTHYSSSEEPIAGMFLRSDSGINQMYIGGGSGLTNALQYYGFYGAANSTTTSGNLWATLQTDGGTGGLFSIGDVSNPKSRVQVAGDISLNEDGYSIYWNGWNDSGTDKTTINSSYSAQILLDASGNWRFRKNNALPGINVAITWLDAMTFAAGASPNVTFAGTITHSLAGLSVNGRATNSTGTTAAITAANDHEVFRRNGTSLGFGAINLASANAVSGVLAAANGGVPQALASTDSPTFLNLTVGSTSDGTSDTKSVNVQSNGYAQVNILGDRGNAGAEPGGSSMLMAVDGSTSTGLLAAFVQGTNQNGRGGTYTGTTGNSAIVGTIGTQPLYLGTNSNVRATISSAGNVDFTGSVTAGGAISNSSGGAAITGSATILGDFFVSAGGIYVDSDRLTIQLGPQWFALNSSTTQSKMIWCMDDPSSSPVINFPMPFKCVVTRVVIARDNDVGTSSEYEVTVLNTTAATNSTFVTTITTSQGADQGDLASPVAFSRGQNLNVELDVLSGTTGAEVGVIVYGYQI